jgi:hypothetical protein
MSLLKKNCRKQSCPGPTRGSDSRRRAPKTMWMLDDPARASDLLTKWVRPREVSLLAMRSPAQCTDRIPGLRVCSQTLCAGYGDFTPLQDRFSKRPTGLLEFCFAVRDSMPSPTIGPLATNSS